MERTLRKCVLRSTIPCAVILGWELLFRLGIATGKTLSAPSLILAEFVTLIQNGELILNAWHSLYLVVTAFSLSCIVAVPLGIAMGAEEVIENLFDPVVELFRPIPPLALLPLAIVWLGIGVAEKLFILIVGTFPPIVINSFHGVKSADRVLIQAARSMGATKWDVLLKVLVPSALPNIFIGMRIAMGFAFTVIVAAELVATKRGLGYLLTIGWRTYDLEMIFVSVITIALLAYLMDMTLRRIKRLVIKWEMDERPSK